MCSILLTYDYIDTLQYTPTRVRMKCRLIFSNTDQAKDYVDSIRKYYNPRALEIDHQKPKVLKLQPYHIQIIGNDTELIEDDEND